MYIKRVYEGGDLSVLAVPHQRTQRLGTDIDRPESFPRTPHTHLHTGKDQLPVVGVVGVRENVGGGFVGIEVSGG